MSKDSTKNKNSQQIFSEDITKQIVKKILDDSSQDGDNHRRSDFNIEYEEYDSDNFDEDYDDYEEDYDDERVYAHSKHKKIKDKKSYAKKQEYKKSKKISNDYRKNIEMYGKEFFDDEEDYDDDNQVSLISKIISISIIVVLTISTTFLALNLKSTKKELTEAKAQIEELLDNKIKTENKIVEESLKNEIEALKEENKNLKGEGNEQTSKTILDKPTQETSKQVNNANNSNNSKTTEYIVKEGDVIWNISKKVYGDGSHYKKILEANGLKEDSILKPGQKLIITKLN